MKGCLKLPGAQINPLLIQQLTNKNIAEIPPSPSLSWLPGKYGRLVNKNKENIKRHFKGNFFTLTCRSCGRKGKYDVGLMLINPEEMEDPVSSIQTTGYFRCKYCNDAGNWKMPSKFLITSIAGVVADGSFGMKNKCEIGKSLLYDGSWHLFSSDAETHFLDQLRGEPNNSFIWNRLGDTYEKGNRRELAACVYEHSVAVDPGQIESHFTLAAYFVQLGDIEKSAYHFKQVLLGASNYQSLKTEDLREMMAAGLVELFYIHQYSNGDIPFLPTQEELKAAGIVKEVEKNRVNRKLAINAEDPESLYPVAEMYMGSQINKLPNRLRTLKTEKPSEKVKNRYKKGKK